MVKEIKRIILKSIEIVIHHIKELMIELIIDRHKVEDMIEINEVAMIEIIVIDQQTDMIIIVIKAVLIIVMEVVKTIKEHHTIKITLQLIMIEIKILEIIQLIKDLHFKDRLSLILKHVIEADQILKVILQKELTIMIINLHMKINNHHIIEEVLKQKKNQANKILIID
jgi:hypothetical protein